jgi:hypothetical protein
MAAQVVEADGKLLKIRREVKDSKENLNDSTVGLV